MFPRSSWVGAVLHPPPTAETIKFKLIGFDVAMQLLDVIRQVDLGDVVLLITSRRQPLHFPPLCMNLELFQHCKEQQTTLPRLKHRKEHHLYDREHETFFHAQSPTTATCQFHFCRVAL